MHALHVRSIPGAQRRAITLDSSMKDNRCSCIHKDRASGVACGVKVSRMGLYTSTTPQFVERTHEATTGLGPALYLAVCFRIVRAPPACSTAWFDESGNVTSVTSHVSVTPRDTLKVSLHQITWLAALISAQMPWLAQCHGLTCFLSSTPNQAGAKKGWRKLATGSANASSN